MRPRPLIEERPEVIRREIAAYFGIDPRGVRVEKHKLGDGRKVAWLRLVWTTGGYMPERPAPRRKPGRPRKSAPPD